MECDYKIKKSGLKYFKCSNDSLFAFSEFGGDLTGNSGQVASPLYPGLYPHSVDYVWTITVETGMRIRITILTLGIEYTPNGCPFDYVQV